MSRKNRPAFKLLTNSGQRKYLNKYERDLFYACTEKLPLEKKLFCRMMYFTGARIGEVMELKVGQLDFADKAVILRTFKQRCDDKYRLIPLPDHLMGELLAYIDYREFRYPNHPRSQDLWWFTPRTGSRLIKAVLKSARIYGPRACPMGLRHGFAVRAASLVPLTQVQIWMGHASLETTAIYLKVGGLQERQWAERLWDEEEPTIENVVTTSLLQECPMSHLLH